MQVTFHKNVELLVMKKEDTKHMQCFEQPPAIISEHVYGTQYYHKLVLKKD